MDKFLGYHVSAHDNPYGEIPTTGIDHYLQILHSLPQDLMSKASQAGLVGHNDKYRGPGPDHLDQMGVTTSAEVDRGEEGHEGFMQWGNKVHKFFWDNGIRWLFFSRNPNNLYHRSDFYGTKCFEVYAPNNPILIMPDPWEHESQIVVYRATDPVRLVPAPLPKAECKMRTFREFVEKKLR